MIGWPPAATLLAAVLLPIGGDSLPGALGPPCGAHHLEAGTPQADGHRTRLIQEGPGAGPLGFRTPWRELDGCGEAGPALRLRIASGADLRLGGRRFVRGAAASVPVDDRTGGFVEGGLHLQLSERMGLRVRAAAPGQGLASLDPPASGGDEESPGESVGGVGLERGELRELAAHVRAGPFHLWAGRRAPGYGTGDGGGIILSGAVPIDGIGLGSRGPGRLPGRAAGLGEWSFEKMVGRMADNGGIGRPYFLAGRGVWAPPGPVQVGFSRGAFFGGEGAPGLTTRRIISLLFGAHHREGGRVVQMTNQTAAFDLSARGRVAGVPMMAFGEVGFEDSAGAWKRSPALVFGVEAAHPERPLRIGLERTYFSGINGHGRWYRHSFYRSGWSDRGRILGHPLAGAGTEWRLHGVVQDPEAARPWHLKLGLRTRDRLDEHSFAPALAGRSVGGLVHGAVRLGRVEVILDADLDRYLDPAPERPRGRLEGTGRMGLAWRW